MSTQIVSPLKQELARLEADVAARPDPRYVKIVHIKQLLADYEVSAAGSYAFGDLPNPQPAFAAAAAALPGFQTETKKSRAKSEIDKLLETRASFHRKELVDLLLEKGILGKEKNPSQTVAVYLSEFKDLEGDGRGNWRRKPNPNADLAGVEIVAPSVQTEETT